LAANKLATNWFKQVEDPGGHLEENIYEWNLWRRRRQAANPRTTPDPAGGRRYKRQEHPRRPSQMPHSY